MSEVPAILLLEAPDEVRSQLVGGDARALLPAARLCSPGGLSLPGVTPQLARSIRALPTEDRALLAGSLSGPGVLEVFGSDRRVSVADALAGNPALPDGMFHAMVPAALPRRDRMSSLLRSACASGRPGLFAAAVPVGSFHVSLSEARSVLSRCSASEGWAALVMMSRYAAHPLCPVSAASDEMLASPPPDADLPVLAAMLASVLPLTSEQERRLARFPRMRDALAALLPVLPPEAVVSLRVGSPSPSRWGSFAVVSRAAELLLDSALPFPPSAHVAPAVLLRSLELAAASSRPFPVSASLLATVDRERFWQESELRDLARLLEGVRLEAVAADPPVPPASSRPSTAALALMITCCRDGLLDPDRLRLASTDLHLLPARLAVMAVSSGLLSSASDLLAATPSPWARRLAAAELFDAGLLAVSSREEANLVGSGLRELGRAPSRPAGDLSPSERVALLFSPLAEAQLPTVPGLSRWRASLVRAVAADLRSDPQLLAAHVADAVSSWGSGHLTPALRLLLPRWRGGMLASLLQPLPGQVGSWLVRCFVAAASEASLAGRVTSGVMSELRSVVPVRDLSPHLLAVVLRSCAPVPSGAWPVVHSLSATWEGPLQGLLDASSRLADA